MNPSRSLEMEQVQRCPLCGSDASRHFDERKVKGARVVNRVCQVCGMVFQSPRMTVEAMEKYYRTEYIRQHQGQVEVTQQQLDLQGARARHLIGLLSDHDLTIDHHLDVGCSTGALMMTASKAYGCKSVGIEPADVYRQYCRDRELQAYDSIGALREANLGPFDLITMAHVLEHLHSPSEYLTAMRSEFLTAKGHILLEVPNLFYHPSFELPHLVSYHRDTLKAQLEGVGFQVLWIYAHGQPRHRRIPLYLTALAAPADESTAPEAVPSRTRAIKLRRTLGQAIYRSAPRVMRFLRLIMRNGGGRQG